MERNRDDSGISKSRGNKTELSRSVFTESRPAEEAKVLQVLSRLCAQRQYMMCWKEVSWMTNGQGEFEPVRLRASGSYGRTSSHSRLSTSVPGGDADEPIAVK